VVFLLQSCESFEELKRFGVPKKLLKNLIAIERKNSIWFTSKEFVEIAERLGAVSGLSIFRKGVILNPTSSLVFAFGRAVKKNIVTLQKKELIEFFEKGFCRKNLFEKGYYLVKFRKDIVAIGFYKKGMLQCMMPKWYRKGILDIV
jgi:hypothetical protein